MNHSQSFLMGGMSQADTKTAALVAEVERLTKELAEANQDATNYRSLRDSKGSGDYAICEWSGEEWSALALPVRDIDARIYEFAAMRRTDAGAKTG